VGRCAGHLARLEEFPLLNILLTDDHLAVRDMCRSIATEVIAPAARTAETDRAVSPAVWKALVETGLTQSVDEQLGGSGVPDTVTQMIAAENLAYGDPGIALAALWNGAVAFLLGRHGAQTHRDRIDQLLGDSEARAGLALYEGYGRSTDELATTIEATATGVHISGRKVAVPFAATASFFLVAGVDPSSRAFRLAVVPADTSGITLATYEGALALDAAGLGTVGFDVTVPESAVVGGPDTDSPSVSASLQRVRLLLAAVQLGAAQRTIDYASKYATERIAFGKPIAGFQGVSFPLAESQMRLAQLRLEIEEAASRLDQDDDFEDHAEAVSAAVAYAAEVTPEAGRTGVQTLGGHGFIKDHPVEIWYRSTAALSTVDFDPLATAFTAAL
jgi:alkylation response protein AidB-like acyl-CoA dehydrogenase